MWTFFLLAFDKELKHPAKPSLGRRKNDLQLEWEISRVRGAIQDDSSKKEMESWSCTACDFSTEFQCLWMLMHYVLNLRMSTRIALLTSCVSITCTLGNLKPSQALCMPNGLASPSARAPVASQAIRRLTKTKDHPTWAPENLCLVILNRLNAFCFLSIFWWRFRFQWYSGESFQLTWSSILNLAETSCTKQFFFVSGKNLERACYLYQTRGHVSASGKSERSRK